MNGNITGAPRAHRAAATYVVVTIVCIGLYDACTGIYLLFSHTPMLVNGSETIWAVPGPLNDFVLSLFQRIGFFSLHVGIITMLLGWYSRNHPELRTLLYLSYFFTGLGFAYHDYRWFYQTDYWYIKQAIGFFFFTALVIQLAGVWKGWWRREGSPG